MVTILVEVLEFYFLVVSQSLKEYVCKVAIFVLGPRERRVTVESHVTKGILWA